MTLKSVLRNVWLLGTTAIRHLGDDPFLLFLQISRRLPGAVAYRGAGFAAALGQGPVVKSVAAYIQGDRAGVEAMLKSALHANTSSRRAALLAEVSLATGDVALADGFLELARASRSLDLSRTTARRRWFDGDMTGAVTALRSAGRNRAADRLESECRVFSGWTPSLGAVTGYKAEARTVLYVLTNSLPHTQSGYAQRSHSVLKAQRDAGWNVHAATRLGYPVQVGKVFAADLDSVEGVLYHRLLPVPLIQGFDGRLQQHADELLRLALRIRPAVLHTTTHFVNALVVREVARVLGIPWVYEVRGQLADTWASSRSDAAKMSERYRLFTENEAQVMQSANLVVTLGEAMKQDIVGKGVDPRNVLLCPNAVGEEYLDQPMDSRSARRLLGLPTDGVYIGTVSSIVDYEGLDDLLRAFAVLLADHPELRCLIVGDGVALPSLKTLAQHLGVSAQVTFTGRVPREKARLHHQAIDIFVVPRKDLGVTRAVTPLKPVEAMACARPVVGSDLPALAEIVVDGVTGWLVDPQDIDCLVSSIAQLVRSAVHRQAFGESGREKVLSERTWAGGAKKLADVYTMMGSKFSG